jgi:hypothetical protein
LLDWNYSFDDINLKRVNGNEEREVAKANFQMYRIIQYMKEIGKMIWYNLRE